MKFLQYCEKVLIAYLVVVCVSAMTSCTNDVVRENMYHVEIEKCLDVVYATSCDYLHVKYDYRATDEKKISVIRCADLADDAGDVLPEMWEYDEIAQIVWPNGYGK